MDLPEVMARHIVAAASDAIITIDEQSIVQHANPAVTAIFGFHPQELLGQRLTMLMPPELRETHVRNLSRRLRSEGATKSTRTVEFPAIHRNGSRLHVAISFGEFERDGRRYFTGVIRDITTKRLEEQRLTDSEERFRDFFDHAPIGCHSVDGTGLITQINRIELDMTGYDYAEVVGRKTWADLVVPEQRTRCAKHWSLLEAEGSIRNIDYTIQRKDGRLLSVRLSSSARRDGRGRIISASGIVIDVSSEVQTQSALRVLNQQYRNLFERNLAGIFRGTTSGRIFECNDAFARVLGYQDRDEFLSVSGFDPTLDPEERRDLYERLAELGTLSNIEISARQKDGTPIWLVQNLSLLDDGGSREAIVEGTVFDITARKIAEERVAFQAHHDSLTGLPNPDLFREHVDKAIADAARRDRLVALMFVDLDQFKAINDTRGHHVGNQILQLVAYRLQRRLRLDDSVARLGGDEFTILAAGLKRREDAALVANKIRDAIAKPYLLDGQEIYLTASVGIAIWPDDATDHDSLLRKADIAMYSAKDAGRNTHVFCSKEVSDSVIETMKLESELRRALDKGELLTFFQPQVDGATGAIVSVEALVRWNHPERGLILPGEFIPLAERSSLIVDLGAWVLRDACRHAASWQSLSPSLRVSVNISPIQFQQPGFASMISEVLEATGLSANLLELEITESTAMRNPEAALEILASLKAMGVRIAIDDFGTGYSSLSHLSRFPIDTLKIDQGFVRDIEGEDGKSLIIAAVIALAHQLHLNVVAEGVETEKQSTFLRERNCEHLQGYLISHPLPADELAMFLADSPGTDM